MPINQSTIHAAMLGDPEAARRCTEAGQAIPCGRYGMSIMYLTKTAIECRLCGNSVKIIAKDMRDACRRWNTRADLRAIAKEVTGFASIQGP